MIGVCEAFALGEKLGLSHRPCSMSPRRHPGQCWSINTTTARFPVRCRHRPPTMIINPARPLMLKDLVSQETPSPAAPRRRSAPKPRSCLIFEKQGNGGRDFSAIIEMLRGGACCGKRRFVPPTQAVEMLGFEAVLIIFCRICSPLSNSSNKLPILRRLGVDNDRIEEIAGRELADRQIERHAPCCCDEGVARADLGRPVARARLGVAIGIDTAFQRPRHKDRAAAVAHSSIEALGPPEISVPKPTWTPLSRAALSGKTALAK